MITRRDKQGLTTHVLPHDIPTTRLHVDLVEPSDYNSRLTANPHKEAIKRRFLRDGVCAEVFEVIKKDKYFYTLINGRNTRLIALKELEREDPNNRSWQYLTAIVHPQQPVHTQILGHLSENTVRGQLLFIEHAIAIANAWKAFQVETAEPTRKKFIEHFNEQYGARLSSSKLSRMLSATNYEIIFSHTFYKGQLNETGFREFLKLRAGAKKLYVNAYQLGDANRFQQVFEEITNKFDQKQFENATDRSPRGLANACAFDYKAFEKALAEEIAREDGGGSSQFIRIQLQHAVSDVETPQSTKPSDPEQTKSSKPTDGSSATPDTAQADNDQPDHDVSSNPSDSHQSTIASGSEDLNNTSTAPGSSKQSYIKRLERKSQRLKEQAHIFIPRDQHDHPLNDWTVLLDDSDESVPSPMAYLRQASPEERKWLKAIIDHLGEKTKQ